MKKCVLFLMLILMLFSPARAQGPDVPTTPLAPQTCGIFNARQAGPIWEIEVGCDIYKEWMQPDSIRFDPEAYYPLGIIYNDGSFVQHHLRGCFAKYGCDPSGDGVRVEQDGQVQYVGYWQVAFPLMGK